MTDNWIDSSLRNLRRLWYDFANNTFLSCFFFFFWLIIVIIDLYFLIPAVIAQMFNPVTDFVILIGISTKEAKAKMETHRIIAEAEIKCSV